MTTIKFDPAGNRVRGYNQQDDFSYLVTQTPLGGAPSTAQSTVYDAVVDTTTTTGTKNNLKIDVAKSLSNPDHTSSFASTDPSIATVDAAGNVAWVSNGTCQIKIKSGAIERRYTHVASSIGDVVSSSVNHYLTGSLGEHASTKIANIKSGKTPMGNTAGYGGSQCLYASANLDVVNPTASWNPNFFAKNMAAVDGGAAIDWSAISVFGDYFDGTSTTTAHHFPCVLVTGRHIVAACHVHPPVGNTVVWLDNSGVCRKATVIDGTAVDQSHDMWVGYLDTDLSPYITPMQIMPAGWKSYLKSCDIQFGDAIGTMPIFLRTMHTPDGSGHAQSRVIQATLSYFGGYLNIPIPGFINSFPYYAELTNPWNAQLQSGDSSSPCMALINGKLTLLFCTFRIYGAYGLEAFSAQFEAAMNSLAAAHGDNASYAFARANLSGFTSY